MLTPVKAHREVAPYLAELAEQFGTERAAEIKERLARADLEDPQRQFSALDEEQVLGPALVLLSEGHPHTASRLIKQSLPRSAASTGPALVRTIRENCQGLLRSALFLGERQRAHQR